VLEFPVDKETAELIEKQSSQLVSPRLVCNDRRAAVIIWGVPLENHIEARRYLFEKSTDSWKLLMAKGDASKVQMFQNWIVVQEKHARGGTNRMTGEFALYGRDDGTSFAWRATADETLAQETEILGMWEKDFVYRVGVNLYGAEISGGKVVNEKMILDGRPLNQERYRYQDGRPPELATVYNPINYVHWVFRMPE